MLAVPDVDFDATTAAEEYLSVQISIAVTPPVAFNTGSSLCYSSYIAYLVRVLRINPMILKMHGAKK